MAKKKLYELTPEHRAQLKPWADRWISNAMSTNPMDDVERDLCREAAKGLYRAAGLTPPPDERIVFVPSPFVMRFAGGFSAAIWWGRKREAATWAATRAATWAATEAATGDATRAATRAATEGATRDATRAATEGATRDATGDATWAATGDATRAATGDATWAATEAATRAATRAATEGATRDATRAATRAATRDATGAATWDAIAAATGAATEAATRAATGDATWAATRDATRDATRAAIEEPRSWFRISVRGMARLSATIFGKNYKFGLSCAANASNMWQGGNQWSGYSAYLSFFRHVAALDLDYSKWGHWEMLCEHSGPRIMHPDFCMISDRPEVLLVDDQNRPHCDDGPFCRWRDGSALYAVHGVRVPWWIVESPEEITVALIDAEENAEVRRVMIDRYKRGEDVSGVAAFLRDSGAELIDRDDRFGRLLRRNVANDEPIVLVHVLNPTPEPTGPLSAVEARALFGDAAVDECLHNWPRAPLYEDGVDPRFKQYFLRVHPELRPLPRGHWTAEQKRQFLDRQKPQKLTARNAVASTWGKRGEDFSPLVRA